MSKKVLFHFSVRKAVKRSIVLLLVLSLFLPAGTPGARAEGSIFYVKPGGTGDCSSWVSACSLQTALTTYAVSGDQIWVAAGTYTPGPAGSDRTVTFQLKDGVSIYGGFAGTESLLSQRNWTTNVVILSGDLNGDDDGFTNNGENCYHVVKGATGASLDGVTIRVGNANGSDPDDHGGGMYNSNSSPTLTNVTYSDNTASYGGGMYNDNSNPMLSNVNFSDNTASGGGGMYNYDNSNTTLSNVNFISNTANSGGGMYNDNSNPMLSNVTFSDNTAFDGGGISNENSSPALSNVAFNGNTAKYGGGMSNVNSGSNPTLNNVTLRGNSADYGGGMYNERGNSPTLNNVIFSNNTAFVDGGGISNNGSSPILSNVTFSGNTAGNGGGMYSYVSSPTLTNVIFSGNTAKGGGGGMSNEVGSPMLTNVTFSGNTANNGGGMLNGDTSTTLSNVTFNGNTANNGGGMSNNLSIPTLSNVTFSGNSADKGGGIYNYNRSSPTVRNSILWSDSGGEIYSVPGTSPDISFSDVQGGYAGTGNIDIDPLLASLGNYGGIVQTIALLPGSPAIDATSTYCPVSDARGLARSSPSCDLGAFESQGFILTKTSGDGQSTPTYFVFAQPLCVAVTANNAGEPVDGGKVMFTPPASGPSALLTGNPALIASGAACASARANTIEGGPYNVMASTAGAASVIFSLTNTTAPKIYLPFLLKSSKVVEARPDG